MLEILLLSNWRALNFCILGLLQKGFSKFFFCLITKNFRARKIKTKGLLFNSNIFQINFNAKHVFFQTK